MSKWGSADLAGKKVLVFFYCFIFFFFNDTATTEIYTLSLHDALPILKSNYVFEIILKRPFSPFLSMLTMTPAYVIPREDVEKWGVDFSSHPSGTGDRKSTRLNSSHIPLSRMPSSA